MEYILKYWPVLLVIGNILAVWITWSIKQGLPSHADVTKVSDSVGALRKAQEEALAALAVRVTHLEAHVEHSPDDEDLIRIHTRLDDLTSVIGKLEGEFHGASRTLDLIHQFLMEGGRRQ